MSSVVLRYTLLRLALLAAVVAVLSLLGFGGWLLVVVAAVVSMALSYVLLRGPRTAMSAAIVERQERPAQERRRSRFDRRLAEDEAAEDAAAYGDGGRPGDDPGDDSGDDPVDGLGEGPVDPPGEHTDPSGPDGLSGRRNP